MINLFQMLFNKNYFARFFILSVFTVIAGMNPSYSADTPLQKQRAGVILLKEYAKDDWAVLMGQGINKKDPSSNRPIVFIPAGMYDAKRDSGNKMNTAINEAIEETGGKYSPLNGKLTADNLATKGDGTYWTVESKVSDSYITLYFFVVKACDDKTKDIGVDSIKAALKSAYADPQSSQDCKEMETFWAIPITEILNAIKLCKSGVKIQNRAEYRKVASRTKGQELQMENNYTQNFINRSNNFVRALEHITGNKDLASTYSSLLLKKQDS